MHPRLRAQLLRHIEAHLGDGSGQDPSVEQLPPHALRSLFEEISVAYGDFEEQLDAVGEALDAARQNAAEPWILDGPPSAEVEAELRTSQQRLALQREQLPLALLEWGPEWVLERANPAAVALFGLDEDNLRGRPGLHHLVHPRDHGDLGPALHELEREGNVSGAHLDARTGDNDAVACEWTLSRLVDVEGRALGYTAIVQNVSERAAAEQALRNSEERYSLAVHAAKDGIWDYDVDKGTAWFSPRCYQILDRPLVQAWETLDDWMAAIHPEDRSRARGRLRQHIDDGRASFEDEWRMIDANDEVRWIHVRGAAIRNASGSAMRLAGSMSDVTERKRHEHQLVRASLHDSLTGLANRRYMLDAIAHRVRQGVGDGATHMAVLFIDMDRFKDVNDRLGHAVGDQLLAAFGQRLAGLVRLGDVVARLGGDEFAVLMPSVRDGPEALRAAERLQEGLRKPFDLAGQQLISVGSVGVATTDRCPGDADALLRAADIAMYSAKARGSGNIALFEPQMYEDVRERVELVNDLRGAMDRGELRLVFQPIVEVATGLPTGFEALLRWRRDGQDVSPAHFVPLAEDAGMMSGIGAWVVEEAARWVRIWTDALGPRFYVSVNMSARELEAPDLHTRVEETLAAAGVQPSQMAIEVTETSMIHAPELSPRLARLRASGHRVLMDDFGTGYASLQNLAQLEFDAIKIDRSFAQRSAEGQSAFLEAIAHLAWRLDKQVIIEGVENEELLARLTVLGIDYVQGYAIARPMEPDLVLGWVQALESGSPLRAQGS